MAYSPLGRALPTAELPATQELGSGAHVHVIPGTRRRRHLAGNWQAGTLRLDAE